MRRALVDTGSCINLIPLSTIQVAKISQKKIQGAPIEIKGFSGIDEYTKGHIQLVLKVGPIVALTLFHVVDSMVPYRILLGRRWLHKHQLVSSTYHQCVKGRLNGKPIRIAANPTLSTNPNPILLRQPFMMKLLRRGKHHLLNLFEFHCPNGKK